MNFIFTTNQSITTMVKFFNYNSYENEILLAFKVSLMKFLDTDTRLEIRIDLGTVNNEVSINEGSLSGYYNANMAKIKTMTRVSFNMEVWCKDTKLGRQVWGVFELPQFEDTMRNILASLWSDPSCFVLFLFCVCFCGFVFVLLALYLFIFFECVFLVVERRFGK